MISIAVISILRFRSPLLTFLLSIRPSFPSCTTRPARFTCQTTSPTPYYLPALHVLFASRPTRPTRPARPTCFSRCTCLPARLPSPCPLALLALPASSTRPACPTSFALLALPARLPSPFALLALVPPCPTCCSLSRPARPTSQTTSPMLYVALLLAVSPHLPYSPYLPCSPSRQNLCPSS